jgi:hypothetical protein
MQQRTNQVLYSYWNDVRGERIAPRRFDVEPAQIGSVLAETFILECDEGADACFRLAGTKICETFGREFRGASFLGLLKTSDRAAVLEQLHEIQKQGVVVVLMAEAVVEPGKRVTFEMVLMPLVHSGASISRILGAITAVNPPAWLGTERLPELALVGHEQIWPDGRPFAIVEKFRQQPTLVPELAGARLVRINRRSFRVLDGGLEKS